MSTKSDHVQHIAASKTYAAVSRSIKTLGTIDMEMENSAIAETSSGRVARLTHVYGAVKPLLSVLSTLPIIPQSWRAALALFVTTLDAVVAVAPQLGDDTPITIDDPKPDPVFKAGKDLDK